MTTTTTTINDNRATMANAPPTTATIMSSKQTTTTMPPPTTTTTTAIHPTSRLPQLYQKHRTILRRLDDLESRLASRAAAHRRRATNLIEETASTRKSHMRIFVSHRVEGTEDEERRKEEEKEKAAAAPAAGGAAAGGRPGGKDFSALLHSKTAPAPETPTSTTDEPEKPGHRQPPKKGIRRWTLVIEGGLLIKHLDHESAKRADARLEAGLPILGCNNDTVNGNGSKKVFKKVDKADIPLRDQWRGGTGENETDVHPLQFTHLFDKLEVELNVLKKGDASADLAGPDSAITRSGIAVPETPPPEAPRNIKSFTWNRKNKDKEAPPTIPDSHAFFVTHDEESEFKPMGGKVFKSEFKVERIRARIKLYRRREKGDVNYVPSRGMCEAFFPTFVGEKAAGELRAKDKSGKNKKRKRTGGGGGSGEALSRQASNASNSSAMPENDAGNLSVGSMLAGGKDAAFASRHQQTPTTPGAAPATSPAATAVEEKDVHIPNTVTMDEMLHAIFFYIRTRKLQDAADLSIVNNDETLSNLFGCSRMLFSAVRGLLVEKQLLTKVEGGMEPIIFNYDMTLDGADPLTKKRRAKTSTGSEQKSDSAEIATRRKTTSNEPENDAKSDSEQIEATPHQTMLSCDVDCAVPNFYPSRTREILRRIKYREFEYTSGRIKALRSLTSTKIPEERAKHLLGDAVAGAGYAPCFREVWMALARGSHEGGEAREAALADLRTSGLMERLEGQCARARGYWDLVEACRGVCEEKN